MNIKEIRSRIEELNKKQKELCESATKEVSGELSCLEEKLREAQVKESVKLTDEYFRLSEIVGDIARKVIVVNFALGTDDPFEITPHVDWLRWGDCLNYHLYSLHKNGPVRFESVNELAEAVEEKYQQALSRLKELGVEIKEKQ